MTMRMQPRHYTDLYMNLDPEQQALTSEEELERLVDYHLDRAYTQAEIDDDFTGEGWGAVGSNEVDNAVHYALVTIQQRANKAPTNSTMKTTYHFHQTPDGSTKRLSPPYKIEFQDGASTTATNYKAALALAQAVAAKVYDRDGDLLVSTEETANA